MFERAKNDITLIILQEIVVPQFQYNVGKSANIKQ